MVGKVLLGMMLLNSLVTGVKPTVPDEPISRGHFSLVYDEKASRVLLFGGANFQNGQLREYGDIWAWDGKAWQKLADTDYRSMGHRLTYDSKRKLPLVFGAASNSQGTFMALTSGVWTPLGTLDGIEPRDTGFAYDSKRERPVLVVQRGQSTEMMIWSGKAWLGLQNAGCPSTTDKASQMAYDAQRDRMVLCIGNPTNGGETWEYDGSKWAKLQTNPFSTRSPGSIVYDSKRGSVVMYGGMLPTYNWASDMWEWDGKGWKEIATGGPAMEGSICYDSSRDRIVFVGCTNHENNPKPLQVWEWDGKTWEKKAG